MPVDEHQSLARRYVRWLRSRKPDATPAQIITTLERRYILATSTVGGANAVAGLLAAFTVGRITDRRLPFGTGLVLLSAAPPIVARLRSWNQRADGKQLVADRRAVEAKLHYRQANTQPGADDPSGREGAPVS